MKLTFPLTLLLEETAANLFAQRAIYKGQLHPTGRERSFTSPGLIWMRVNLSGLSFSLVGELSRTTQVKSPINQHRGQLLDFDIPASSLEAQVREEAGHTSTHLPKTGSTQVNHREQGDPVRSRRNVTARMVAWEGKWGERVKTDEQI